MTEKILNLKLKYKNKYLDTVKYQRDFTNHLFIGSNKKIFWQILDKAFPGKYELVSKKGSHFELNLREGMDFTVDKDGETLTKDDLRKVNLLKDNRLILKPETTGNIQFSNDWAIEYLFLPPYKYVPSKEELALAKQFSKVPALTPDQKFTRIFLLLALLVTAIGLYIGEKRYVPPVPIDFASRLQRIEETATRVETYVEEEEEIVPRTREEREEVVTEEVQEAEAMSAAEFESEFGLDLAAGGGDEDLSNQLLEVTEVSGIVAAVATSPSGSGSALSAGGTGELESAGEGSFDLKSSGEGLGDLGGLSGLDLGGTEGFEEVDIASLGGDVGEFQVTKVESRSQFEAVKKRFAGIKMLKEESIELEEQTPEDRSQLASITQIVNTYKPQITKLFTVESMMMEMYGTIEFNLIIGDNGQVEAVNIIPASGSYFTDSFLDKAKQVILKWKIVVKEPVQYNFRMKFLKQ